MANKSETILVVDDVEANVLILEEILKDKYNILTAGNGRDALDILADANPLPKIVLLDVVMPKMTGSEMFEIMKTDEKLKRIPVIFITSENDSENELLKAGAVDFIRKPFSPDIVSLRVKNQIDLKNYSDSLEVMVAKKTAEASEILNNALQGLASAIENRDLESGEHVKRTQLYIKCLMDYFIESGSVYAEELLKLQPDIIMNAMALHDVGKIAIPDRILLKPGKLDPDEYEIMKTHTTKGREIINEFGNIDSSLYLRHCADISYCHHERWDGKGYPNQIREYDIPLTARLAALADVYDALVCQRVYKAAMPYEKALGIISEGRGTQFDPVVTDAMMQIHGQFEDISRKYIV